MSETAKKTESPPASTTRRSAPNERLASVYLWAGLGMKLRLAATTDRRTVSDVVSEAVNDWLERRLERRKKR